MEHIVCEQLPTVEADQPDAGAYPHGLPAREQARLRDRLGQELRQLVRVAVVCAPCRDQDAELVPPEPSDHCPRSRLPAQLPRRVHQHHVTGVMTEPVVDRLESVEVAEEQPGLVRRADVRQFPLQRGDRVRCSSTMGRCR